MGYEWLDIALARLRGIEPHEVLQALYNQKRRPTPAFAKGVTILTIWARTHTGRPIIVGLRHRHGRDWHIIGARDMNPDELGIFEEWEATE